MKRAIFFVILILMLAVSVSQAQWYGLTVNDFGGAGGRAITDSCYVVSTNSYYSKPFSLAGLLESSYDSAYAGQSGRCISIYYAMDTVNAAAGTDVCDITLILQGSFTGKDNWSTAATIFSAQATTAATYTTMATTSAKYPYYRWKATGITTNTYSRVFVGLYAYRVWR